jgi:ankyrin repeat protein
MLKYLHSVGATLNPRGAKGITILMHAAREGCIESINYLIENGADLNEKSDDGNGINYYVGKNVKNQEEVKALIKSKKK